MEEIKAMYKAELIRQIEAWEGLNADDFQYEPERAQLKDAMKAWLKENMKDADDAAIMKANRMLFAKGMAELVYVQKVQANVNDFLLTI